MVKLKCHGGCGDVGMSGMACCLTTLQQQLQQQLSSIKLSKDRSIKWPIFRMVKSTFDCRSYTLTVKAMVWEPAACVYPLHAMVTMWYCTIVSFNVLAQKGVIETIIDEIQ
jgi:hypothetical protein